MEDLTELGGETNATVTDDNGAEEIARLTEELKEAKDDKSAFGRKFKSFQEDSDERYNALLEKIEGLKPNVAVSQEEDADYYDSDDDEVSSKKLLKMARQIAKEEAANTIANTNKQRNDFEEKYIRDYDKTVMALGEDEDPAFYEQILGEIQGMKGHTQLDGSADAELNFLKASNRVLRRGKAGSGNNNSTFRQNNPAGTMVGGHSQNVGRETTDEAIVTAKNDPHVASFLRYRAKGKGDNDEFMKRVYENNNTPTGKRRL